MQQEFAVAIRTCNRTRIYIFSRTNVMLGYSDIPFRGRAYRGQLVINVLNSLRITSRFDIVRPLSCCAFAMPDGFTECSPHSNTTLYLPSDDIRKTFFPQHDTTALLQSHNRTAAEPACPYTFNRPRYVHKHATPHDRANGTRPAARI